MSLVKILPFSRSQFTYVYLRRLIIILIRTFRSKCQKFKSKCIKKIRHSSVHLTEKSRVTARSRSGQIQGLELCCQGFQHTAHSLLYRVGFFVHLFLVLDFSFNLATSKERGFPFLMIITVKEWSLFSSLGLCALP